MQTNENLKLIRDILLRTFIVGFGLMLLSAGIYYGWQTQWDNIIQPLVGYDSEIAWNEMVMWFFGWVKCVLFYGVLTPALGLQWTIMMRERDLKKKIS